MFHEVPRKINSHFIVIINNTWTILHYVGPNENYVHPSIFSSLQIEPRKLTWMKKQLIFFLENNSMEEIIER